MDSFNESGIAVVVVSVDPPGKLQETKGKVGAEFSFLSDANGQLFDVFGLRHVGANPMNGSDISRPATVVLDTDGKLALIDATTNYRVRPSAEKLAEKAAIALGVKETNGQKN